MESVDNDKSEDGPRRNSPVDSCCVTQPDSDSNRDDPQRPKSTIPQSLRQRLLKVKMARLPGASITADQFSYRSSSPSDLTRAKCRTNQVDEELKERPFHQISEREITQKTKVDGSHHHPNKPDDLAEHQFTHYRQPPVTSIVPPLILRLKPLMSLNSLVIYMLVAVVSTSFAIKVLWK